MKVNLRFWKTSESGGAGGEAVVTPPKRRRFEIPADKVLEIRRLADRYAAAAAGQSYYEADYLLWKAISEIFPEILENNSPGEIINTWSVTFPTELRVVIVEKMSAALLRNQ